MLVIRRGFTHYLHKLTWILPCFYKELTRFYKEFSIMNLKSDLHCTIGHMTEVIAYTINIKKQMYMLRQNVINK